MFKMVNYRLRAVNIKIIFGCICISFCYLCEKLSYYVTVSIYYQIGLRFEGAV